MKKLTHTSFLVLLSLTDCQTRMRTKDPLPPSPQLCMTVSELGVQLEILQPMVI